MEAIEKQDFLDTYFMIIPGVWEHRTTHERYVVTFDFDKAFVEGKYVGEIK